MFVDIPLELICIYKIINYKSGYIIGFKDLDTNTTLRVGTYLSFATLKVYIEESLWLNYIKNKENDCWHCYCWNNITYPIKICDDFTILHLFNLIINEINNYNEATSYIFDYEDSFRKRCNNIANLLNRYVYFLS